LQRLGHHKEAGGCQRSQLTEWGDRMTVAGLGDIQDVSRCLWSGWEVLSVGALCVCLDESVCACVCSACLFFRCVLYGRLYGRCAVDVPRCVMWLPVV
jgi:hypothetical protein